MQDLGLKLQPAHTALLVIDLQVDFAAPHGLMAQRGRDLTPVPPMLQTVNQLVAAATRAGVLVCHTQQIYDRSKLNPLQREQYDLDGKLVSCDIAGAGYNFYGLDHEPKHVFTKHNYNAFSNPALAPLLEQHQIKTLIVVGMDTCYCVETALRNGHDLGYKIVVPADAVACNGKHPHLHQNTLELVQRTYGVVTDTPTILHHWQS